MALPHKRVIKLYTELIMQEAPFHHKQQPGAPNVVILTVKATSKCEGILCTALEQLLVVSYSNWCLLID